MATKNVTIRISEEMASWLSDQGEVLNQTIVNLLNNFRNGRQYALNELKGIFDANEWLFFADSLNGVFVLDQFRFNKKVLIGHCEDSEELMGHATKHKVNMHDLLQKIETLSASQVDALYYRVERFWSTPSDLEQWANY